MSVPRWLCKQNVDRPLAGSKRPFISHSRWCTAVKMCWASAPEAYTGHPRNAPGLISAAAPVVCKLSPAWTGATAHESTRRGIDITGEICDKSWARVSVLSTAVENDPKELLPYLCVCVCLWSEMCRKHEGDPGHLVWHWDEASDASERFTSLFQVLTSVFNSHERGRYFERNDIFRVFCTLSPGAAGVSPCMYEPSVFFYTKLGKFLLICRTLRISAFYSNSISGIPNF